MATRESHDVTERDFEAFKADVADTGGTIVASAPIPSGYAVTIEWS